MRSDHRMLFVFASDARLSHRVTLYDYSYLYRFLDMDECQNSPCQNGATCVNKQGSYECKCLRGYMGRHCDTGKLIVLIDLCVCFFFCRQLRGYDFKIKETTELESSFLLVKSQIIFSPVNSHFYPCL